jgi:hypothetical protein
MRQRRPKYDAWLAHATAFTLCGFTAFLVLLNGCGRNGGPARYDLTGKITCDGKSIRAGYIVFVPDKSKGNDGPGAGAEIHDGVYKTRPNDGVVGGPHIAKVSAFDGKAIQVGPTLNLLGTKIFLNAPVAVSLPKEATTYDIDVPLAATK